MLCNKQDFSKTFNSYITYNAVLSKFLGLELFRNTYLTADSLACSITVSLSCCRRETNLQEFMLQFCSM